jgi:hypothetical protein
LKNKEKYENSIVRGGKRNLKIRKGGSQKDPPGVCIEFIALEQG